MRIGKLTMLLLLIFLIAGVVISLISISWNIHSEIPKSTPEDNSTPEKTERTGNGYVKTDVTDYDKKASDLFDDVVKRVTETRGYMPDVPLEVVTKEWVVKKWGSPSIDEERLKDEEIFYKSLLLVPSNFSFETRKNKEVGGFMAFYWKNKVYVVKENFDPDSKNAGEALAHELEHVIQDMYFSIKHDQSFDGNKAYGAIVEGDAVLMGWIYAGKKVDEEVKGIDQDINCSAEPNKGYGSQESDLNFLYFFPYTFGTKFIAKAYLKGGYKAVDEILKNPPITTEQILHPEKRNEGFEKVKVDGDDYDFLKIDLNDFKLIKDTRMGEFFLYVFLSSHLPDCYSFNAAEGWNGDNLKIFRKNNEFVFYWKIMFDDESEAIEFQETFEKMLDKVAYKQGEWWITKSEFTKEKIKFGRDGKDGREILIAGYGEI
jgi:hypothetical protein